MRKIIIFGLSVAIVFASAFTARDILAYDGGITHPALIYKTSEIYNKLYNGNLSGDDISAMAEGSTKEDLSPRWVNHFYDPTTGGSWGDIPGASGWLSGQDLKALSRIMVSSEGALSSLGWARAELIQDKYSLYGGKRTWKQALDYYIDGNRYEAMKTLGHILHLLQDASVPAHVRQDPHSGILGDEQDPYELFTTKRYDLSHLDNIGPQDKIACSGFDQCFKDLAMYTNNNFFSRDTFGAYPNPRYIEKSVGFETHYYHESLKNLNGRPLLLGIKNGGGKFILDGDSINSSYWQLLSRQVALTGAEIINIFYKDVEDRRVARDFPVRLVRYNIPSIPMFSPIGELQKARDFTLSLLGSVGGFFGRIFGEGEKPEFTVDLRDNTKSEKKESRSTQKESDKKKTDIPKTDKPKQEDITAVRAIDGDTIELSSGALVRYIGIDAPEIARDGKKAECFANEAKKRNETLVLGKAVRLERGPEEADRHGRQLRYVWVGDTLVNQKLVEEGAARAFDFGYPHFYTAIFAEKSLKAKGAQLGIFGPMCASPQKEEKKAEKNEKQQDEKNAQEEALQLAVAPEKLLINEVRAGGDEFVEIYNPSSRSVPLGTYYFAYYSSSRDRWDNPWRSKQFPDDAAVAPNGYYVIAFGDGALASNWKPYDSRQLADRAGTVALWFGDPKNTASRRIDAVGWGSVFLSEGAAAPYAGESDSIIRFPDGADTDFNASDFRKTSKPTPGGANVFVGTASGVGSGGGGGGGGGAQQNAAPQQSTTTQPGTNTATTTYPKLLITEVQIESPGNVHDEFVELYNPNDHAVVLTGWYLQKKTTSTRDAPFRPFAPKSLFKDKSIAKHSYLVIAHPSSTVLHDIAANHGIAKNNTIVIKNPNEEIVDKVGWGNAGDCEGTCAEQPDPGHSIQRKMESGAFLDTDNNRADFEIRTCPSPGSPSATCPGFSAHYNPDRMSVTLSWMPHILHGTSHLPNETSPGISYEIRSLDKTGKWDNGTIFIADVRGTSTEQRIFEVGRQYVFAIKATKDGVPEDGFATSSPVAAPSLLSSVFFYENPIDNSTQVNAYYDNPYPFIPAGVAPSISNGFSAIEFILHIPGATSTASAPLSVVYRAQCNPSPPGLVHPRANIVFYERGDCPGGLANDAAFLHRVFEDSHFTVKPVLAPHEIDEASYITASYHFVETGTSGDARYARFPLVAKDAARWRFFKPKRDELANFLRAPTSPEPLEITPVTAGTLEPFFHIRFTTSTDPDSYDELVRNFLTVSYTASTSETIGQLDFGWSTRIPVVNASSTDIFTMPPGGHFPRFYPHTSGTYMFAVQACDEIGLCASALRSVLIDFPAIIAHAPFLDTMPFYFMGPEATSTPDNYISTKIATAQEFTVPSGMQARAMRIHLGREGPAGARIYLARGTSSVPDIAAPIQKWEFTHEQLATYSIIQQGIATSSLSLFFDSPIGAGTYFVVAEMANSQVIPGQHQYLLLYAGDVTSGEGISPHLVLRRMNDTESWEAQSTTRSAAFTVFGSPVP